LLRASNIEPVVEKEPLAKISADATGPSALEPPAIKTLPSCSNTADEPDRAWAMLPVGTHVSLGTWIAGEAAARTCMISIASPTPPINLILDLIQSACSLPLLAFRGAAQLKLVRF
jgi:hypothetical protein